ncbi:MAG: FtsX-like permease family protein [Pseudomonadota bacterium]
MFRNALAAALRNLARKRYVAAVGILGLAIGLSAALLAALVIRSLLTHDHFIEGYDRIYSAMSVVSPPARGTVYMPNTSNFVAARLKLRFPEVESVTRLALQPAVVSRSSLSVREQIYWADPNLFDVLPMPVIAGDPRRALRQPDSLVLTRAMARKYFGSEAPLGEILQLDGHPLTVGAVIEDLPANATHLRSGIFAPALASWSWLGAQDAIPTNALGEPVGFGTNTYLRLAANASPDNMLGSAGGLAAELFAPPPQGWKVEVQLTRLDRLNAHPAFDPSFAGKLAAVALLGCIILIIAVVNFVNLLTARFAERGMEIRIRKVAGASSRVLMLQFLGESLLHVLLSGLLALALTEWLLQYVNAFLGSAATLDYFHDGALTGAMLLALLVIALLAGGWPAVSALKSRSSTLGIGRFIRQGLVALQFAMLISLIVSAGVVEAQRRFAVGEALRLDIDQMLVLRSPCNPALVEELRGLPGVRALGCSSGGFLNEPTFIAAKDRQGVEQFMYFVPLQPEVFGLYGVKPIAGRLDASGAGYVINETASRRLGFAQPGQALGFALPSARRGAGDTLPVIGVVPDFAPTSVEQKVEALGYIVTAADTDFSVISMKLTGRKIPETLAATARIWGKFGKGEPINQFFVRDYLQRLYVSMRRQAQAIGAFSMVAAALGSLGLLGLAASVVARRTKEIGIRKALGAATPDVLRLVLWDFARPVLWANLLAWPVTGLLMVRWLRGYAYHVDLPLWMFPAAGLGALVIALATVGVHALRVAAAKPITALRYE